MENEIKLSDNTIMYHWLVDRLATGYNVAVIKELYAQQFDDAGITDEQITEFRSQYYSEIEKKHEELKELIFKSGMFYRAQRVIDDIYRKIEDNPDLSPKEYASLADTMRKYLEYFNSFGKTKQEVKQVTNNNFLVLQGLADEGLIQITNPDKLRRLIDGNYEEEKTTH
jgi:DNA-binding transcriptional MerR regulator